jgi:hypothetical protein
MKRDVIVSSADDRSDFGLLVHDIKPRSSGPCSHCGGTTCQGFIGTVYWLTGEADPVHRGSNRRHETDNGVKVVIVVRRLSDVQEMRAQLERSGFPVGIAIGGEA